MHEDGAEDGIDDVRDYGWSEASGPAGEKNSALDLGEALCDREASRRVGVGAL